MSGLSPQYTDPPELRTTFRTDHTLPILLGDDSYDAARASVWRDYVKEASTFDDKMVKAWNETLDLLLLFAALFSAIVTAFLVAATVSPSPVTEPSTPTAAVSVNSLWFLSLSISLLVSIAIMHVKHWIRSYMKSEMSTPRERARLRQYRYEGILKWRLGVIVDLLPMWLQISVLLFLIGMVVFLWTADNVLGGIVIATIGATMFVYAGATILPTIYLECPFVSPLSHLISYAAGVGEAVVDVSAQSFHHLREDAYVNPLMTTELGEHPPRTPGFEVQQSLDVSEDYFSYQSSSGGHSQQYPIRDPGPTHLDRRELGIPSASGSTGPLPSSWSDTETLSEPMKPLAQQHYRRPRPPQRTYSVYKSIGANVSTPSSQPPLIPDSTGISPRRPPLIYRGPSASVAPHLPIFLQRRSRQIRKHSSGIFIPHSQRTRQADMIKKQTAEIDALALEWLVTYSEDEDIQGEGLLAFIGCQPLECPSAKWSNILQTIVKAADHAFFNRIRSVAREARSLYAKRFIPQLPRLAGLCNVVRSEEVYSGLGISSGFLRALFDITNVQRAGDCEMDQQSSQLLTCVVLLHLRHHWSIDFYNFHRELKQLLDKCVSLFKTEKDLPLYGTCMFMNYMALRRMQDLDEQQRTVLYYFLHDMTTELHGGNGPIPFQLGRVLQHLQNRLPPDTPTLFRTSAEPMKSPDSGGVRFLLTPPAEDKFGRAPLSP